MKSFVRAKFNVVNKPLNSRLAKLADKLHIQAHLAITELRLRARNNSSVDRVRTLQILHEYWRAGRFPQNTYSSGRRLPVFIDQQGTHCAVGYLMARTGHAELAKEIDKGDKFVFVENLDDLQSKNWLQKSGLTHEEAALIQPGYSSCYFKGGCDPLSKYQFTDKVMALVSIAALGALIALLIVAVKITRNTSFTRRDKVTKTVRVGAVSLAIFALYAFYIPNPKEAATILYCMAAENNPACVIIPERGGGGGNILLQ